MSHILQVPGKFPFDQSAPPDPPRSLKTFVAKLLAEEYEGDQRRGCKRAPLVMPIAAMPLDGGFLPSGEAFTAIARDISTTGLRIFSTRAAGSKLLAVRLAPRQARISKSC